MSHFQKAVPVEDAYADTEWNGYGNSVSGEPPSYPDVDFPSLFTMVGDETDDNWIVSNHQPSNRVYVCRLTQLVNPEDLEGDWTIKVRAKKASSSVVPVNLTIDLFQDYGSGTSTDPQQGLIASQTFNNIPSVLTDLEFVVPEANKEFVLDPMLLYVRITADS